MYVYHKKRVNSFVGRKFKVHRYLKGKKRSKATKKKSRYVLLFWKISVPSPALLDLEIPVKMQIGNWWV